MPEDVINPCLLPSERLHIISPNMSETDWKNLKEMECACLDNAENEFQTWGLFSRQDELFGGSGYKDHYESAYGPTHLYEMNSPHRISDVAIQEKLIPIIKNIIA
jgi:hypothetical protein